MIEIIMVAIRNGKSLRIYPIPSPHKFVLDVHVGHTSEDTFIMGVTEFDEKEIAMAIKSCLDKSLEVNSHAI
jgi:hypothetical protein